MNSSAALLSILLALGLAVVGIFWGINERNGALKSSSEKIAEITRQGRSDFGFLEKDLENSKAETVRLEDENRTLRRQLDIERDSNADLIRQKDRLELRLAGLRNGDASADQARDWTDDELDRRKSSRELTLAIRELSLKRPLRFRFTEEDGMREALPMAPALLPLKTRQHSPAPMQQWALSARRRMCEPGCWIYLRASLALHFIPGMTRFSLTAVSYTHLTLPTKA